MKIDWKLSEITQFHNKCHRACEIRLLSWGGAFWLGFPILSKTGGFQQNNPENVNVEKNITLKNVTYTEPHISPIIRENWLTGWAAHLAKNLKTEVFLHKYGL